MIDAIKVVTRERPDLVAMATILGSEHAEDSTERHIAFDVLNRLVEKSKKKKGQDAQVGIKITGKLTGASSEETDLEGERRSEGRGGSGRETNFRLILQDEIARERIGDVRVPRKLVVRYGMRLGDTVEAVSYDPGYPSKGLTIADVLKINGESSVKSRSRRDFERLTPIHPNRRLRMERSAGHRRTVGRMLDLMIPLGFGQRALITAPPRTGKTVMLKEIALAVEENHPEAHLIVLLVDERPEEVTDMLETVCRGEVVHSNFDAKPQAHIRAAEEVIERARREVELGRDVVILMDSITRLSRAYSAIAPASSRTMTGGVASGSLQRPKQFFGSARAFREGGSLTIIATALVETNSRMDEVIFEEFKGTGNAEIILDRQIADRRMYPAIDILRSGTREDERLFVEEGDRYEAMQTIRKGFLKLRPYEAVGELLSMMDQTESNEGLLGAIIEQRRIEAGNRRHDQAVQHTHSQKVNQSRTSDRGSEQGAGGSGAARAAGDRPQSESRTTTDRQGRTVQVERRGGLVSSRTGTLKLGRTGTE